MTANQVRDILHGAGVVVMWTITAMAPTTTTRLLCGVAATLMVVPLLIRMERRG